MLPRPRRACDLAAVIGFHPSFRTPSAHGPTLETLQLRHTAHRPFLAREVSQPSLERLRSVAGEPGVRFALCERADRRRSADVLSVRAVATLFGDDAYRMELLGGKRDGTPFLSGQAGSLIFSHAEPARRLAQQVSAASEARPWSA